MQQVIKINSPNYLFLMKLKEGEIYTFQVLKTVEIPDEGIFFLLRHKSGRRLMIETKPYEHYGIEPGKPVECIVDKVSCTGKVYLEPLHPKYRIGNEYSFNLIDQPVVSNEEDIRLVTVADVFNNHIVVNIPNEIRLKGNEIVLVVNGITKGIPELRLK